MSCCPTWSSFSNLATNESSRKSFLEQNKTKENKIEVKQEMAPQQLKELGLPWSGRREFWIYRVTSKMRLLRNSSKPSCFNFVVFLLLWTLQLWLFFFVVKLEGRQCSLVNWTTSWNWVKTSYAETGYAKKNGHWPCLGFLPPRLVRRQYRQLGPVLHKQPSSMVIGFHIFKLLRHFFDHDLGRWSWSWSWSKPEPAKWLNYTKEVLNIVEYHQFRTGHDSLGCKNMKLQLVNL